MISSLPLYCFHHCKQFKLQLRAQRRVEPGVVRCSRYPVKLKFHQQPSLSTILTLVLLAYVGWGANHLSRTKGETVVLNIPNYCQDDSLTSQSPFHTSLTGCILRGKMTILKFNCLAKVLDTTVTVFLNVNVLTHLRIYPWRFLNHSHRGSRSTPSNSYFWPLSMSMSDF